MKVLECLAERLRSAMLVSPRQARHARLIPLDRSREHNECSIHWTTQFSFSISLLVFWIAAWVGSAFRGRQSEQKETIMMISRSSSVVR